VDICNAPVTEMSSGAVQTQYTIMTIYNYATARSQRGPNTGPSDH